MKLDFISDFNYENYSEPLHSRISSLLKIDNNVNEKKFIKSQVGECDAASESRYPDVVIVHFDIYNAYGNCFDTASGSLDPLNHSTEGAIEKLKTRFSEVTEVYINHCLQRMDRSGFLKSNAVTVYIEACDGIPSFTAPIPEHSVLSINYFAKTVRERVLKFCKSISKSYMLFNKLETMQTHWFDARYYDLALLPFTFEKVDYLATEIAAQLRFEKLGRIKCIAVDFDNTLWGGVYAEGGAGNILHTPDTQEGRSFYRLQVYLSFLSRMGIIICGVTRNDPVKIQQFLGGIKSERPRLSLDAFYRVYASFKPKSESIRDLVNDFNILPDSIIFLDDSEAELDEVSKAFPRVLCIQAKSPDFSQSVLQCFLRASLEDPTAEDVMRRDSYKSILGMQLTDTSSADENIFNNSESETTFLFIDKSNIIRCSQLISKTNQFKLNSKQYSQEELASLLDHSDILLTAGVYKDQFLDYGIIFVAVASIDEKIIHVKQLVLSCRAFNRGIFEKYINYIRGRYPQHSINFDFQDTGKNKAIADELMKIK